MTYLATFHWGWLLASLLLGLAMGWIAVVHRGHVLGLVPKEKLPTYNVFYEGRTFSRGGRGLALDAGNIFDKTEGWGALRLGRPPWRA